MGSFLEPPRSTAMTRSHLKLPRPGSRPTGGTMSCVTNPQARFMVCGHGPGAQPQAFPQKMEREVALQRLPQQVRLQPTSFFPFFLRRPRSDHAACRSLPASLPHARLQCPATLGPLEGCHSSKLKSLVHSDLVPAWPRPSWPQKPDGPAPDPPNRSVNQQSTCSQHTQGLERMELLHQVLGTVGLDKLLESVGKTQRMPSAGYSWANWHTEAIYTMWS